MLTHMHATCMVDLWQCVIYASSTPIGHGVGVFFVQRCVLLVASGQRCPEAASCRVWGLSVVLERAGHGSVDLSVALLTCVVGLLPFGVVLRR